MPTERPVCVTTAGEPFIPPLRQAVNEALVSPGPLASTGESLGKSVAAPRCSDHLL